MPIPLPVDITEDALDELGRELDAIYDSTIADLGEADERYIRRLIKAQRSLALGSRIVMLAGAAVRGRRSHRTPRRRTASTVLGAVGMVGLGVAKVVENMEIGHNVMHGQWDWMRDPDINSVTWEWDNVCPSDQWKHGHNVVHHTWTNVLGKDRDIGYEIMRVTPKQPWNPVYLAQPLYNTLLGWLFEWGVGVHEVDFIKLAGGTAEQRANELQTLKGVGAKAARQVAKDYVLWPALAGPGFVPVLMANVGANLIRNLWTYMIIFCGHFPQGVYVFDEADVEGETRARWYVRQLLGSANIRGSRTFHVFAGNLDYQIEHHLYPDMPSNRYQQVAPRVRALCARYGLPYNSARLTRQFGTTTLKIWRLALPGGSDAAINQPMPPPAEPSASASASAGGPGHEGADRLGHAAQREGR
jgi:linoleoyl-CoA desaturase